MCVATDQSAIVTEIVTMRTFDGIKREEFIEIVYDLERSYHSKQPGFIDSELLYNEKSGEWIMIQHWSGMDELKAASKGMFGNPLTVGFVKALDAGSVKMLIMPQLGRWTV